MKETHPLANNVAKATAWRCVTCGKDNKATVQMCSNCGHEPTTGRRDVNPEGRRYTPGENGGLAENNP